MNYKQLLRWLWRSTSYNRLQALLNVIIGLLDVAVSLAQIWAVKHAIDVASHNVEGSVIMSVGVIALLILCNFILSISSVWVRNVLGIKAQNRMQQMMLERILRSEWRGRGAMHSGDVINRLESDGGQVVNCCAETLRNAVCVFTLFVGAFFFLFSLDHLLAICIVCLFPVFLLLSKVYMGRMRRLSREVRESDSLVQSMLQESVQNRMLIKTLEGEGTMVDSHVTIGSCAQVGKQIHISAATQIGGVLEPAGALPTIIEDGAFIGGNCGIYEGTIVEEGAVIASGVIITSSTPLFDATKGEFVPKNENGRVVVPRGAVVVSGSRPVVKGPSAGSGIHLYCPVIVKYRDEKTSGSVSLEELLR